MNPIVAHPILSCAETKSVEARLLAGDTSLEWEAMQRAGRAVAEGVRRDFREYGKLPREARILVLVGKGHNGGDALIAAHALLRRLRHATADVLFVFSEDDLKPLTRRSWQDLQNDGGERVRAIVVDEIGARYDVGLDGIFGFQFHPPLEGVARDVLAAANQCEVTLRAAVDLPSGLDEEGAYKADFTYATGVVKTPLLDCRHAGRLRYLDLGFFDDAPAVEDGDRDLVLTTAILNPLRAWRDPQTDKRHQGHVFIVAGSRDYPGAALMAVLSALRSGAGLVTAFVPETLVPAFAAQVPEGIWVGWPETPNGGLALEGRHLLQVRLACASAVVLGPGLGREPETLTLAGEILKLVDTPVLVDADALQSEVITHAKGPLVLTPHAGEFARIAGGLSLRDFAVKTNATVVLKGQITRVCAGGPIYHSLFGGPVLARGGSGDLLAGMIGAQLARTPADVLGATCRGVAWHGLAADELAQTHGATAVRTTQLLDFLGSSLRMRE